MTDKEKYEILLFTLAEKLKEKDTTISLKDYEIESLKKKLEEAEIHKKKAVKIEIRKEL